MPHVAILTPPGRGAVASVVVSGPGAVAVVSELFQPAGRKSLAQRSPGAIAYGRWDGEGGEELVVCRRDAEHVEIHCHGGVAASTAIVDALVGRGCTYINWQDWLEIEVSDAIRRDAIVALSQARTERTAAILLDQYHGSLTRALEEIRAHRDAGRRDAARELVQKLLARAPLGRPLVEPWRVVLSGHPNVGKSSLINALVGYQRSIVYDAPGTTRDVVTAHTAFEGWPVELSDTAGLREGMDELEAAGIERAHQQLAAADQVVLVFDASHSWSAADTALLARFPQAIIVHNKCDLATVTGGRPPGIMTSAVSGAGVLQLQQEVIARLCSVDLAPGDAVPFTDEHVALLNTLLT